MTTLFYVNSPDDDWQEFPAWADWCEIPDWASFFIKLGEFVVSEPLLDERIVIAVALPTRAFAAALTAAGVVKNCQSDSIGLDKSQYFKSLCELAKETPKKIKYLEGSREKDYILLGSQDLKGELRLKIQTRNQQGTNPAIYISKKDCHKIKLVNENSTESVKIRDLPSRQKGKKIHQINSFTRDFLQIQTENSFEMQTSLDCLLIGSKKDFLKELNEITFACSTKNSKKVEGNLAEILRVKQFFSTAQPSHCEFISAEIRRKSLNRRLPENAPVTIFDGANGFLKLRDYFRASHWIILLDRTEGYFQAAIEQLNNNFSYCKSAEIPNKFPDFPPEIEAMFFTEMI